MFIRAPQDSIKNLIMSCTTGVKSDSNNSHAYNANVSCPVANSQISPVQCVMQRLQLNGLGRCALTFNSLDSMPSIESIMPVMSMTATQQNVIRGSIFNGSISQSLF